MSFPYKILNDLSMKLKSTEILLEAERQDFQIKIKKVVEEYEAKMRGNSCQTPREYFGHYQETATSLHPNRSVQTSSAPAINQISQTEPINDNSLLQDEVVRLRKMLAEVVHENNRYHFRLSYCTCCLSDACHDVSPTICDESIRASTPLDFNLPSLNPVPLPSSVPAPVPMPNTTRNKRSSRDKAHISRMVQCLSKLEKKYQTPPHKRKERIFRRKPKTCSIVPKEFSSIYLSLAAPESEVKSPELSPPKVDWQNVRFRPPLPNPVECTVYGCSVNPKTYQNDGSTPWSAPFYRTNPFGTLLGYRTTEGVIAVPKVPVGGYVYCTEVRQWILKALPPSSVGRGTRKGERSLSTRRRKG